MPPRRPPNMARRWIRIAAISLAVFGFRVEIVPDQYPRPPLPRACDACCNSSSIPLLPPCGIAEHITSLIVPTNKFIDEVCNHDWVQHELIQWPESRSGLDGSILDAASDLEQAVWNIKGVRNLCKISQYFPHPRLMPNLPSELDHLDMCELTCWHNSRCSQCYDTWDITKAFHSIPELLLSFETLLNSTVPDQDLTFLERLRTSTPAQLAFDRRDAKVAFDTTVQPVYSSVARLLSAVDKRVSTAKNWDWKEDKELLKLLTSTRIAYAHALYVDGLLHIVDQMLHAEIVYLDNKRDSFARDAMATFAIDDDRAPKLRHVAQVLESRAPDLGSCIRMVHLFNKWMRELQEPASQSQLKTIATETSKKFALEKFEHCIIPNDGASSRIRLSTQPLNQGFRGHGCAAYLSQFYRWWHTEWQEGCHPAWGKGADKTGLLSPVRLGRNISSRRPSFDFYKERRCFPPEQVQDYCVEYPLPPLDCQ